MGMVMVLSCVVCQNMHAPRANTTINASAGPETRESVAMGSCNAEERKRDDPAVVDGRIPEALMYNS